MKKVKATIMPDGNFCVPFICKQQDGTPMLCLVSPTERVALQNIEEHYNGCIVYASTPRIPYGIKAGDKGWLLCEKKWSPFTYEEWFELERAEDGKVILWNGVVDTDDTITIIKREGKVIIQSNFLEMVGVKPDDITCVLIDVLEDSIQIATDKPQMNSAYSRLNKLLISVCADTVSGISDMETIEGALKQIAGGNTSISFPDRLRDSIHKYLYKKITL